MAQIDNVLQHSAIQACNKIARMFFPKDLKVDAHFTSSVSYLSRYNIRKKYRFILFNQYA